MLLFFSVILVKVTMMEILRLNDYNRNIKQNKKLKSPMHFLSHPYDQNA